MNQKRCPQCGREVEPQAKFCPECGTPVGIGASKGSKTRGHGARDAIIIIGVLVVVALVYFLIKDQPESPQPPQSQMPQEQVMGQESGERSSPHSTGEIPMAMLDSLPRSFDTLVGVANEFMDNQNFAVAAEVYRRALELNPSANNVRTDYGACLHGIGLPDRAADEFRKVLNSEPEHPIATFNMGIVMMEMDQRDSAKYYWERYLAIDPNGGAAAQARQFLKEVGG